MSQLSDVMTGLNRPTPMEERRYRIGRVVNDKNGKATVLTYVDARYVMDVLDEICGADNWSNEFMEIKGNLFCKITIAVAEEQEIGKYFIRQVSKMDVGVPSNFESEKGEASDSFKRCAVHFGIGRDLYHVGTMYATCVQGRSGWMLPHDWQPDDEQKQSISFTPATVDVEHFNELIADLVWTDGQRDNAQAWINRGGFSKSEWDMKIAGMEKHVKGELE